MESAYARLFSGKTIAKTMENMKTGGTKSGTNRTKSGTNIGQISLIEISGTNTGAYIETYIPSRTF